MLGFDVKCQEHGFIRCFVKAEEGDSIVPANAGSNLCKLRMHALRAANFNDMHLVVVGRSVLGSSQSTKALVSKLGSCRRVSPQVTDEKPGKKRLFVGHYIKHKQLHFSRLCMNFAGDFHGG